MFKKEILASLCLFMLMYLKDLYSMDMVPFLLMLMVLIHGVSISIFESPNNQSVTHTN